jgi:predicted nucleic acid-binding protein
VVILDTEFLFGLNETDPKHSKIKEILDSKRKSLKIPSIAVFEYILVLLSKNISNETIIESLSILNDIFNEYDLKILELDLNQLIEGLKLRSAYRFGFFDCLIAGTAIASKELLIGDDKIFKNIKELTWQNYQSFISS